MVEEYGLPVLTGHHDQHEQAVQLLQAARNYAALALEQLVACYEADEDDLERLDISLLTIFLFPTLSDAERASLCRVRYIGHYLFEARSAKPFGLTPLRLKRLRSKLGRLAAERR